MKFLQENYFGEALLESAIVGNKLFLEGPMVMANAKNRNGRSYDLETVARPAVERYNREYIGEQRAIGELEHPEYPMPKLSEAAVFIKDPLVFHGSNAHGKMEVLNNQKGQQIRALHEAGFRLGTSTRGLGDVDRRTGAVKAGYLMTASDVVDKPSGQVCYMDAVNESVDWELKNGVWVPQSVNGQRADTFLTENADNAEVIRRFKAVLDHLG